jgi:hypothetical protein
MTSNTNVPTASSSANPASVLPTLSYDQTVAENARRVADNLVLQNRRNAGELNVPSDEPILPLPPNPNVPVNKLHHWVAAFAQLSPASQAQGSVLLNSIMPTQASTSSRPNVAAVSKVLFDSSKEAASSGTIDSTYNFGIHSFIQDLADAGQYCPLTLFSAENTERLHREGHSLKRSKIHVNGVSHHLLDLSQFDSEVNLDTLTWQEAYQRYLTWIADVGDQASLKRWTNHFSLLSKDEAVRKNFRAILEFDIETRQNYALRPHQHNQAEWEARLQRKKYSTLQDAFFTDLSFPDRPPNLHSARFDPYDRNGSAKRGAKKPSETTATTSFRDSNKSSQSTEPLCIICGRLGHRFSVCSEEISAKGSQTFAKYASGNLCKRTSGSQICVGFNLNNPRRPCKREHPDQHLCSFCGKSEHSALSRQCI